MQGCAPEAVDISSESDETKQLYGLNDPVTEPFGKQCLLARRLVERGVRFVQLISGAYVNTNVTAWDAHDSVDSNHRQHGKEVDKPITGLITDMKRRGLLDETVVMLHSEFGRMPISQRGVGRDHNPGAMTVFMCGAGIQGGQAIGTTDDVGLNAEEQPTSNHDIHASISKPDGHGPQEAHLLLQRPQHAIDGRGWRIGSADHRDAQEGVESKAPLNRRVLLWVPASRMRARPSRSETGRRFGISGLGQRPAPCGRRCSRHSHRHPSSAASLTDSSARASRCALADRNPRHPAAHAHRRHQRRGLFFAVVVAPGHA